MKRIEIYLSEALEENLEAYLEEQGIKCFSKINPTYGKGASMPMLGNEVWPGANTTYILYVEDEKLVMQAIDKLRLDFPKEGIAAFLSLGSASL